jgi:hypothetical protein
VDGRSVDGGVIGLVDDGARNTVVVRPVKVLSSI